MMADIAAAVGELAPLGVYTETLARLYWQQGHLGEALRIYHHLAAERPDNLHFQEQVHALEEQRELAPNAPLSGVPPLEVPPEMGAAVRPESATDITVHANQEVIDQLERWLHRLQGQRRLERLSNQVELTA